MNRKAGFYGHKRSVVLLFLWIEMVIVLGMYKNAANKKNEKR